MPNFIDVANEWLATRMLTGNVAVNAGFTPEVNEYINTLITKEAFAIFINDLIPDRFAFIKRGNIDVGSYIASIAIEPAEAENFPQLTTGATVDQYKVYANNLNVYYHPLLVRSVAPMTLHTELLRTSWDKGEIGSYIGGKMQSLTNAVNRIRMRTFLQLVSRLISAIPAASATNQMRVTGLAVPNNVANAISFVQALKTKLDTIEAIDSTAFNIAGHASLPARSNLIALVRADINASLNTYASQVFNPDYLKLGVGHVVVVPGWGGEQPMDASNNVLYEIHTADGSPTGTYSATQGGTTAVPVDHWDDPHAKVAMMIVDENTFNRFNQTELMANSPFNARGLFTNYFAHWADTWLYLPQKTSITFETV